jgi:LAO/AO transport system kinase
MNADRGSAPQPFALRVDPAPAEPPPTAHAAPLLRQRARPRELSVDELAAGVRAADRAVLARAISLVESTNPAHQQTAQALLARVLPFTGSAARVGITGVPGAGKSTLIDRLGTDLTAAGRRVAVLAVDPSSTRTGGSILGDKTRMARLAADPNAYIRPSPTAGTLGGVARRTRETMLLCEAAGFDTILIETVGVGQSETTVADMTDLYLAVLIAGAGDELQGIKRGLLDRVDVVAVNKADGDNAQRAAVAAAELDAALRVVAREDPAWRVPVLPVSARTGSGLADLWRTVDDRLAEMRSSGLLADRRRRQALDWMHALLDDRLHDALNASPAASDALAAARRAVADGSATPAAAAERVLAAFLEARGNHRSE